MRKDKRVSVANGNIHIIIYLYCVVPNNAHGKKKKTSSNSGIVWMNQSKQIVSANSRKDSHISH